MGGDGEPNPVLPFTPPLLDCLLPAVSLRRSQRLMAPRTLLITHDESSTDEHPPIRHPECARTHTHTNHVADKEGQGWCGVVGWAAVVG